MRKFLENNLLATARPEAEYGGLGKDATIRQALDSARGRISEAFKGEPLITAWRCDDAVKNALEINSGNGARSLRGVKGDAGELTGSYHGYGCCSSLRKRATSSGCSMATL